jgi:hypothetical protein
LYGKIITVTEQARLCGSLAHSKAKLLFEEKKKFKMRTLPEYYQLDYLLERLASPFCSRGC